MIEVPRIITVVNRILKDRDKISGVIHDGGGDYWFLFDDKHKWYLRSRARGFELRLYNKGDHKLDELASLEGIELDRVNYNEFSSIRVKNDILQEAFENLYNLIKYKDREFDDDFTEILSDL